MAVFWYGLVPMAGALVNRYRWYIFRKRFDELRLRPILDYSRYRQQGNNEAANHIPAVFRFIGGLESVTDGKTLWIRSNDLTIPVSLENAETYLLPMQKREISTDMFDPGDDTPEKIRWDRVSALTEGAKVFVGGFLANQDGRLGFVSTKENRLMVIFYDGSDESLTSMVTRAGRHRDDYWNAITPYSLIIGALCQILIAVLFISRPAFRLTVIASFVALFIPLYPIIPPGLLFAVFYRHLAWKSRMLRISSSIARLPFCYLAEGDKFLLPNGELYGYIRRTNLPQEVLEGNIPLLLPDYAHTAITNSWLIFGVLHSDDDLPSQPEDPFATFGILPEKIRLIARQNFTLAYILEIVAWLVLMAGIALNIFLLSMALSLI